MHAVCMGLTRHAWIYQHYVCDVCADRTPIMRPFLKLALGTLRQAQPLYVWPVEHVSCVNVTGLNGVRTHAFRQIHNNYKYQNESTQKQTHACNHDANNKWRGHANQQVADSVAHQATKWRTTHLGEQRTHQPIRTSTVRNRRLRQLAVIVLAENKGRGNMCPMPVIAILCVLVDAGTRQPVPGLCELNNPMRLHYEPIHVHVA